MRWTEEQLKAWEGRVDTSSSKGGEIPPKHPAPVKCRGKLNKTELRYEQEILKPLLFAGEILAYRFEGIAFRLADRTFYHPDFLVVYPGHFEVHEIKGFWQDDARVKFKVVAELYPWFVYKAIQYKKKQWITEEL